MITLDQVLWVLIGFVFLVAIIAGGGFITAIAIGIGLLLLRYGPPFVGDLLRERQKGISSAKVESRVRKELRGGDDE